MSANSSTVLSTERKPTRGLPAWAWALMGVGFALLLILFFFAARFFSYGLDLFKEDAIAAMRANPVIIEQIGELSEVELDLMRSGTLPGSNEFAFRVKGSRGSGLVIAEFLTEFDGERLGNGVLQTDDGKTHALPGKSVSRTGP
jgi:hypothetical protein